MSTKTSNNLKELAQKFISSYSWATFHQLQNFLKNFISVTGIANIQIEENLIVWGGMSDDCARVIVSLIKARKVYLQAEKIDDPDTFHRDELPPITIKTAKTFMDYKRDVHWLPVVLTARLPEKRLVDAIPTIVKFDTDIVGYKDGIPIVKLTVENTERNDVNDLIYTTSYTCPYCNSKHNIVVNFSLLKEQNSKLSELIVPSCVRGNFWGYTPEGIWITL